MSAQQTLLQEFGEPDITYQEKYCTVWNVQEDFPWFPVAKMFINIQFMQKLKTAFTALQNAGIQGEIKIFSGCYNERSVRGRNSESLHAWAAAIDLNAPTECMVNKPAVEITEEDRRGEWSEQFITIMKSAGISYGGDFVTRPDPMHFALLDG